MDVVQSSSEWDTTEDWYEMIHLPACRDHRKRRLVMCAVGREMLARFPDAELSRAVEFAEARADGNKIDSEWEQLRQDLRKLHAKSSLEDLLNSSTHRHGRLRFRCLETKS